MDKTGKKIWLNSCEWGVDNPWEWMSKYANSWRTGPDHHDEWTSTATIIELNAELGKYAGNTILYTQATSKKKKFSTHVFHQIGPGGWNDPDFIYTGGQVYIVLILF